VLGLSPAPEGSGSMPVEGACRIERTRTIVFLAMCVLIGILASPMRPGVVLGESMAPTFHSGQVFLTSRVAGREALQKGDVVLLGGSPCRNAMSMSLATPPRTPTTAGTSGLFRLTQSAAE
jgi:signal peptidase I